MFIASTYAPLDAATGNGLHLLLLDDILLDYIAGERIGRGRLKG